MESEILKIIKITNKKSMPITFFFFFFLLLLHMMPALIAYVLCMHTGCFLISFISINISDALDFRIHE